MMKILDFGCGNGDGVHFLAAENKSNEIIGVDLDISLAASRYPDLQFIKLENGSLPFAADCFDVVYASDVLEHVSDLESAITEITRVLKAVGKFIISIPHYRTEKILAAANPDYLKQIGHQRIFARDELEKKLEQSGFKIISRRQKGAFLFFALWLLLRKKKNILNQRGEFEPTPFYKALMVLNQFFDWEITFKTRAKYLPLWLIAWPLAWIFDKIYPKTIKLVAVKK